MDFNFQIYCIRCTVKLSRMEDFEKILVFIFASGAK